MENPDGQGGDGNTLYEFPLEEVPQTDSLTRNAYLKQLFAHYGARENGDQYKGVEQYHRGSRYDNRAKKPNWCCFFSHWSLSQVEDYAGVGRLLPRETTHYDIDGPDPIPDQLFMNSQKLREAVEKEAPDALIGQPGQPNHYVPKLGDIMIFQSLLEKKKNRGHIGTVVGMYPKDNGKLMITTIDGNLRKDARNERGDFKLGYVALAENEFDPETGKVKRLKNQITDKIVDENTKDNTYNAYFINLEQLKNFPDVESRLKQMEPFIPTEPEAMIDASTIPPAVEKMRNLKQMSSQGEGEGHEGGDATQNGVDVKEIRKNTRREVTPGEE